MDKESGLLEVVFFKGGFFKVDSSEWVFLQGVGYWKWLSLRVDLFRVVFSSRGGLLEMGFSPR